VACQLVAVRDFFDDKWLGFSGKVLGAVGVRGTLTTVPPFHPHRVVSERRFVATERASTYEESPEFELIHIEQPSERNLSRRADSLAPGTAFAWYTTGSSAQGRGALMVYIPVEGGYWMWYVSLARDQPWRVARCSGISRVEFAGLERVGSARAEP
jgi:hypothetical protein